LKPKVLTELPLVGRNREINQLMQYFNLVLGGREITVFICGEAGVGKTRLANEFLNLVRKRGATILVGRCLSKANIPYFPFREALNAYVSAISDEKAKFVVKKQLSATGWLEDSEVMGESKNRELFSTPRIDKDRTFEAVARFFLHLSKQNPVILFIDDLHWADQLSLTLLHYLSRKCKNSQLLILGTYRPEELICNEEKRLHPLEETIFSMSREDLLFKMELNCLKRNDFPDLLRPIFGFSLDKEYEEMLYEESGGNPLFAIETINMLIDEGRLVKKKGSWTFVASMDKIGVPSKVHEVIIRRIARLGGQERKLLSLAAVCGYRFTPDILSKALALDLVNVLETLVKIEQKHRLIRSIDSVFEFTHHKIREVIYRDLPNELRRIYHIKIASCIEQVLAEKISEGYSVEVALHFVEGGAPEKAFKYLVKFGEKAVNIFANTQAIEYLNKALEATQRTAYLATSENLYRIYQLRGRAWLGRDEGRKALKDFNLMLQNATNIGDESMIAEAHYWLGKAYMTIEEFSPFFSEMDKVIQHFMKALENARRIGNKLLEGRIAAEIGSALIANLDTMDEGCMWLEASCRICEETDDKVTKARSFQDLGWYYNWKGDFNKAKDYINKALALANEIGATITAIHALFMLTIVLAGNGEYNEAISTGRRCLQLAQDCGRTTEASWVLNTLGWIYHDLSNIELAIKYNKESIKTARAQQKTIALGGVPHALANLGMDYLYKKDHERAEKYFEEANKLMHQHPSAWWRMRIHILLGRGEIALAKGNYTQALKFAEELLAIAEKAEAKKYIAKSLKLKAEVLAKMDDMDEAIELMEDALKLAQQVGNPPLLWQVNYSLGLLFERHGNPQEANMHYANSLALIEAVASKLNNAILKSTLLTSPVTRTIRAAYARTVSAPEEAAGIKKFEHAYIQAYLVVPEKVNVGETFEVRIDMVNVAMKPGMLVRIEGLVPDNFKVIDIVPEHRLEEEGTINVKGKCLKSQKVESIRIWVKASESGILRISPRIIYVDELGKFKVCRPEPVTVAIYPPKEFEFKMKNAQKVFEYLTKAFVEDYMRRRLTLEKSGWRTFMQIIKNTEIPKSSIYGTKSHHGPAILELEKRGIIEIRIFPGERGRGGNIMKARISYEKDEIKQYIVKRYVNHQVMKFKEK